MNHEILNILEDVLGIGIKAKNKPEVTFYCPFCNHHKPKLAINLDNSLSVHPYKCWVCGKTGAVHGLFRELDVDESIIDKVSNIYKIQNKINDKFSKDDNEVSSILKLPVEYIPLHLENKRDPDYRNAISYLCKRGIGIDDIIRYKIGYCGHGSYSGKIIVPSYNKENKLNYFIARAYYDETYRYKNPFVELKEIIGFENMISFKMELNICEGVFDAIAIKRNAIPLFGKRLFDNLFYRIIGERPPQVNIILDNDAIKTSIQMVNQLIDEGINTHLIELPNGEDPASLGFAKISNLIRESKPANKMQLMKLKLTTLK